MIIDFHVHIGRSIDTATRSVPKILRDMKHFGVTRSMIFPINEKDTSHSYKMANRRIARLAKKQRCFIGCARLNPNHLAAAFHQIEFARQNRFRAVKFHPLADSFNSEQAAPLFPEIERNGFFVMLHTGHERNSWVKYWYFLVKRHPKITFIFAHGGKDHYRDAIRIAKHHKNVYLETTTLSFYRTGIILKQLGPRKVVFGSDTPYSHLSVELTKYQLLLSPAKRKLVFSENAKRILKA